MFSEEGEQGKQDKAGESANVWSWLGTSFSLNLREAPSLNCSSGLGERATPTSGPDGGRPVAWGWRVQLLGAVTPIQAIIQEGGSYGSCGGWERRGVE